MFDGTAKYGSSYYGLEEMMVEAGVTVDHRVWLQKRAKSLSNFIGTLFSLLLAWLQMTKWTLIKFVPRECPSRSPVTITMSWPS